MNSLHNLPETDHEAANNVEGGEARDGALVAASKLAKAVHPGVGAFHHPAQAVQGVVLQGRSTQLPAVAELSLGDTSSDAPLREGVTKRSAVVAFVGSQSRGSASVSDMDPINGGEGLLEIVDVPCREGHGQGNPVPVGQAVTLRRLVAEFG